MAGETKRIMSQIESMKRGTIFFPSDFSYSGINSKLILKVLERASKDGVIIRLATGVYCYPRIDKKYGMGVLYPSYEQIASRIAERDNIKIVPSGAFALNVLGLSTQVPLNMIFLTDGRTRTITLFNGYGIKFTHTSQKNFAFKDNILMLLNFALKDLGREGITEEQTQRVGQLLSKIPEDHVKEDLHLMPEWMRNFMLALKDKQGTCGSP